MIGRLTLGAIALATMAGGAPAALRSVSVSGNSTGFKLIPLFDARLGTLRSVIAESTYELAYAYNYGMTPPVGFDGPVSIYASLGAVSWQMDGTGGTSGGAAGFFSISAAGRKSFTAAADLAALTGDAANITAYLLAPTPAPSGRGTLPRLGYSLTFNYDDAVTAAVPEPAGWAMMIGGFLGVGAMLRARRRSAAAA